MRSEDVATLFEKRPGYRLVDFEEVGLPVYWLTAIVTTLQPKAYPALDEFVLRSVAAGLTAPTDLGGFLGVGEDVVVQAASRLIRGDELIEVADGELALTERSRGVLAGEESLRPREHTLQFHFDATTRRPVSLRDSVYYTPRDLRGRGTREIRPIPAQRPDAREIAADQLQVVLSLNSGRREMTSRILQVKTVTRALSQFVPAVLLAYRREDGGDLAIGFAIDGRLSVEHENAFAERGGPQRIGVASLLRGPVEPDLRSLLGEQLASGLSPYRHPLAPDAERRDEAIARFKREVARQRGEDLPEITSAKVRIERTRVLAAHEHPPLLASALETARSEVVVVTENLSSGVVDDAFIRLLRAALERGVRVDIAFRSTDFPDRGEGLAALRKVQRRNSGLRLTRIEGDDPLTLRKDRDWIVVTSFDWLAYRGNPGRILRETRGTQIAVEEVLSELATRIGRDVDASLAGAR